MSPPPRRPTLRDIATETGLSTAAVSYALRGLRVPEETQQRVRAAADRLGYRPNAVARQLAGARSSSVGVLASPLADSWHQFVVSELVAALPGIDRHAIIVDGGADPDIEIDLATRIAGQPVDALVVMSVAPTDDRWHDVGELTRLISLGDTLPAATTTAEFVYDNALGVTTALTQIAEAGHRRVTVLAGGDPETPDRPIESVVRTVAPELGLEVRLDTCSHDLAGLTRAVETLLSQDPRPTAVFCIADSIAWGVYAAARSLGLRIPEDLSVVGFDNAAVSSVLAPPLATYAWPVDDLVASVISAIDGETPSSHRAFAPVRVPGGSVAPPKEA